MSFQTPITIAEAIKNIESNHYLLPSIQREFKWKTNKIEWLFDSIMRDYPISSFLFWRVEGDTKQKFKFYKFINEFREKYKTHNEEYDANVGHDFTAILDGQQRLTSLYIGLRGNYAYKTPRLKEEDTERSYPTRKLYLNIINPLVNEEDGREYEFKFLSKKEYESEVNKWFLVSTIFGLSDDFEFNKFLDKNKYKENEFTYKSLSKLKNVIHSRNIINFYLEKEQDIDKALNIFIRINSGGEPLSFSDLIMSIAVANWKGDARNEIYELVDEIRDKGFYISKDFILKSFLYLYSKDIKFKVTNFSKENAVLFETEWVRIKKCIIETFELVRVFGFNNSTLTSHNALLPIIYYLFHRNIFNDFSKRIRYDEDRKIIKRWLHIVLLKRVFGGSSDGTLNNIRKSLATNLSYRIDSDDQIEYFPEAEITNQIKKDIGITDEFLDSLLMLQKDDAYAFSILALLYPNLDYKNNDFHKDHLHSVEDFEEIDVLAREQLGWKTYNSIKNLQMLDSNENMSKQDISLEKWIDRKKLSNVDLQDFLNRQLIPNVDLKISNFADFIYDREKILKEKLWNILK